MNNRNLLSVLLLALGFSSANASAESLPVNNISKAKTLYLQAQQFEQNKEYQQALDYIERAEKVTPNNSDIYLLHAKIFSKLINGASIFSIRGYFVGMRENLEKVLELAPENIKAKHLLVDLYMMLPGFLGGDEERAQLLADQLYEQDPIEGNIANANIHIKNENYPQAIYLLKSSMVLAPQRLKIQIDLADLFRTIGKNKEAMSLFLTLSEDMQNKDSYNDNKHQQLANVLWQIGSISLLEKSYFADAELAMTTYIKIQNSNDKKQGKGYLQLADIYLLQGKIDIAKILLINAKAEIKNKKTSEKINNRLKSI